jgi:hypothetical protein
MSSRLALRSTQPPIHWVGVKTAGAWSWLHTYNWWRGQENVGLCMHSPIRLNGVVLNFFYLDCGAIGTATTPGLLCQLYVTWLSILNSWMWRFALLETASSHGKTCLFIIFQVPRYELYKSHWLPVSFRPLWLVVAKRQNNIYIMHKASCIHHFFVSRQPYAVWSRRSVVSEWACWIINLSWCSPRDKVQKSERDFQYLWTSWQDTYGSRATDDMVLSCSWAYKPINVKLSTAIVICVQLKKIGIVGGGVQLGPLGTAATNRPIVPAPGDYDDGKIGGTIDRGTEVLGENLIQCFFVHHKSHMLPRREPGPPRWEASD